MYQIWGKPAGCDYWVLRRGYETLEEAREYVDSWYRRQLHYNEDDIDLILRYPGDTDETP